MENGPLEDVFPSENVDIPFLMLMEEILHHLECTKPCKSWHKLPTSTGDRRISETTTPSHGWQVPNPSQTSYISMAQNMGMILSWLFNRDLFSMVYHNPPYNCVGIIPYSKQPFGPFFLAQKMAINTLPETNIHRTWKWMLGMRTTFLLGPGPFSGMNC